MTMWDEVYAPLGLPRAPTPAPARRRGWASLAAVGAAAALIPASALAPGRAPLHTSLPAPSAIVAKAVAPIEPPPALRRAEPPASEALPPAGSDPAPVKTGAGIAPKSQPTGGPLIIDVSEALARLKQLAPESREDRDLR